ncbi:2-hydroxyacid dehydrogenase [Paraburkholderia fungorum]|uniref:2-hydroxyacid dehydrogenase n=1 Tax=Paraburkholderia fungorum TaxID=134537 RepID=UPI00002772D4|nr:2-hydroxyacid dehydrogenase [Paraburkholderia fungorum]PNE56656.1 2-hydroxyacid dehydrogenase [Paraburkholderia fungorum]USU14489.1 2-hydroxyacid dehydrogenase [Paraburkholderia fungorum]USU22437.1 2-hydroxyacid dehydrogenase [Paraburkholderia fungorum]
MHSSPPQAHSQALHVLVAGPLSPDLVSGLDALYETRKLWLEPDQTAFLQTHGPSVDVLATSGIFGADEALMNQLPNLRLIASFGVGTDPIDLDAARARGIVVTNTPDVLNECVADTALGLLLALARRIVQSDRLVRAGEWTAGRKILGTKLGGKVCGIVGFGGIGREIAKRVTACGMRVAYYGPTRKNDVPYLWYPSLVGLARDADVLILSLPGGTATHHVVDTTVLQALGPDGMLVNVARGSVVDEAALVSALEQGAIRGAALDVFEHEPEVPSALFSLDNVVLTPHIGSGTSETREAMTQLVLANIAAFAAGRPLLSPVR